MSVSVSVSVSVCVKKACGRILNVDWNIVNAVLGKVFLALCGEVCWGLGLLCVVIVCSPRGGVGGVEQKTQAGAGAA